MEGGRASGERTVLAPPGQAPTEVAAQPVQSHVARRPLGWAGASCRSGRARGGGRRTPDSPGGQPPAVQGSPR